MKEITLFPRINRANCQVNFQLKKSILPNEIKNNLSNLQSVKLKLKDFKFKEV
ncbi:MAG: hypothetical protein M0R17_06085 [Candidatus Omnitrophica bacterium]|jgi:hypothetical protein|nr:hypothetical protein [Candidatus Omnitrophota bacterium]